MHHFPTNLRDHSFTDLRELETLMRATWGHRWDYCSLYMIAKTTISHPGLIVEIGTNWGESAIVMGNAIRGTGSRIVCIDPVFRTGSIDVLDENPEKHQHYDSNLMDLFDNIAEQHLEGYISIIPDYSQNVLARWDCGSIDLLYVDGEHSYEGVKRDCEWMAHVKPGGYVIFDDWMDGVAQAVTEYYKTHQDSWHLAHGVWSGWEGIWNLTALKKLS